MGFISNGIEKAVNRQKSSIESEAKAAGCIITDVIDLTVNESSPGRVVTGILKDIVGGKSGISFIQLFRMKKNNSEFCYFQPFEGLSALPGEYHSIIDGAIPDSIILKETGIFAGRKWHTLHDREFEKLFNSQKSISKRIEWSWKSGFTSIDFKWAVQIKPVDEKSMHLVMRAGRYGGFTAYKIGLDVFLSLREAIKNTTASEKFNQPSGFIEPVSFENIFAKL